jgi:hypothetical protein
MKSKDLFAGCSVTITPHDDVWLVSLNTEEEHIVAMRTFHELPEALEAVNLWTTPELSLHSIRVWPTRLV